MLRSASSAANEIFGAQVVPVADGGVNAGRSDLASALPRGEPLEERRADPTDSLFERAHVALPVDFAQDGDLPAARPFVSRHDRKEGALAGTVGAEDCPVLSRHHLPPDIAQNVDAVAGEGFDVEIENQSHRRSLALRQRRWSLPSPLMLRSICAPMQPMPIRPFWIALCLVLIANAAYAQDPLPIHIEGTVPPGPETHFFIEFEVPEGIAEIEVQHENLTSGNTLDWGLDDPNGFRGWGGGKSQPAIVGLQAALPSYVPGPIPAGTWEVVVGKARIVETPAEYAVDIFLRTEPTLEAQPRSSYEDPGVLDTEARWYAGDFHIHTVQSDGRPTMREALEFAQTVGLDFVMLSEHNTNSGLTLYGSLQPDFPDLLMVPGSEWTTYSGHASAIGAVDWVDQKIGVRGVTVEGAIEAYQDQGALFSIDHPTVPGGSFCIGCPWEIDGRRHDHRRPRSARRYLGSDRLLGRHVRRWIARHRGRRKR